MNRPQSIPVGNRNYKVVIDPTLQLHEELVGVCHHQNYKISLLPRFLSCQLDETLWHEVLHAIDSVYLNNKMNEDDIKALSHGLSQVTQSMGITFEWEEEAILKGGENASS